MVYTGGEKDDVLENTVFGMFEQAVRNHGDSPAVIESGRTLTFRELSDLVDVVAGVIPGGSETVGIVMSHRAEMVAGMLAALKMGARYVPAEPSFPSERICFMMDEAGAEVVLTETAFTSMLEGRCTLPLECVLGDEDATQIGRTSACEPDDAAYVLYTSGTTGRPKGICVTNANVCHYVRAFAREFRPGPGDVMLQHSVYTFDIFVEEVFASLLSGAAIAIPSKAEREDVKALMGFVERYGVTMLSGFPYLLAEINRLEAIPESLRLLISGGDVLRARYVDNLLGRAEVYNTYGPSETTVCATYFRCNGAVPLSDGTYPIGRAVQGACVRVLGSDGREMPQGEPGELCITGGGVFRGYIGGRDEENRAFEELSNGSVMYRSGDAGYVMPSGDIAFLHRLDSQVMVGGRRVEVMEVEHVLNKCEGVAQAVVRASSDDEGMTYLTSYVVPDGGGLSVADLRARLSESLADFMVPEFFVQMRAIPLNVNGKPDTAKLPVVMKEAC